MKIGQNTAASINYTLYLEDGNIADSSEGNEPLTFLFGYENIIPGLEKALEGLQKGDKKTVVIPPAEAYGDFEKDGFQELDRSEFPDDVELEVGMQLILEDEEGYHVPAIIDKLTDKIVTMNFNHPLAGETLKFDVEVVDVREATKEEIEHGHPHGPDGHHHH
ncbi:MAG: peptidylprolyl isomerase [Candidatus Sericytochromatia bacterium]